MCPAYHWKNRLAIGANGDGRDASDNDETGRTKEILAHVGLRVYTIKLKQEPLQESRCCWKLAANSDMAAHSKLFCHTDQPT